MPAMDGCEASRLIDSSRSAAWFIPAPICLVWSTSVCTPSASCALPSAKRVGAVLHPRDLLLDAGGTGRQRQPADR